MKYLILILFMITNNIATSQQKIKEPTPPIKNKELSIHNHIRTDPYYWMNERDTKPVLKYLEECDGW